MSSKITILMTSDVHACIFPYSYATKEERNCGLAKAAHMIDRLKDENTIVIDNGDVLEGSPFSYFHFQKNMNRDNPFTAVMNMIPYDFYNLGNHDFNYGQKVLADHMDKLKMTCLTSNVFWQGKPFSQPYHILHKCGKTVAIFGILTHFVPFWEKEENITGMEFQDAFETAKQTVQKIRENEKADYIIGVYHGGMERDPETGEESGPQMGENQGYRMCMEIEGIDVLLCGHQHHPMQGTLRNTVYIQPAHDAMQVACVEIDTVTGEIVPKLLEVTDPAKKEILDYMQEEEDECQKWLDQPLGESRIDLKITDEFDARLHKTQLITFMNKVCGDVSGADISANALFLRAKGFEPKITMRDLVSTYVFPNTLMVKKINGKILKQYLERCAMFWDVRDGRIVIEKQHDFPTPQYHNYDMCDGIEYEINVSRPVGERIVKLTRNGKDIKENDIFTLCINNYRAAGGGDFPMLKETETVKDIQKSVVEIIADYITRVRIIDFEPVNNIKVYAEEQ